MRFRTLLALGCLHVGCGGTDFDTARGTGDGGTGGASGSGGSGAGNGGITVVQRSLTMLATEEVPTLTLQALPHAGHAIIVGVTCISDYLGDCIIESAGVTDNQGNTYTRVVQSEAISSSAQAARGYIFIAENIASPSGSFVISVDPLGPEGAVLNQSMAWGAIEVSGLAAPPTLDAWGISLLGGPTSTTAATDLPTVVPSELAVAVFSMRSGDTNMLITPEETWESHHIHQNNSSGPPGHSMVSKVLTSTGVVTHTWTHDVPTRGSAAVIATFQGAAQN